MDLTTHPIHPLHRLYFFYLEPVLIIGGILQVLLSPLSYTAISHPTLHTTHLAPNPHLASPLQTLFTCIAGGWAVLAVNNLVTLRVFARQPDVWRCVVLAHLCSDLLYVLALAQDLGGWARFVHVPAWGREEWLTNSLTLPGLAMKVAVVAGCGVDYRYGKEKMQ